MKRTKSGFSVLELVIVMAIMLIVAALAVPSMRQVMDNYRLNSSGHAIVDMLQQARMAAIKGNLPYYAQVNAGNPMLASATSASGAGSSPTVSTVGNIAIQAAGVAPLNITDLNTYLGGAVPPGGTIGFNARGIPCTQGASPYICTGPQAFVWFMQSGTSGDWEAVTVTAAGRVRAWRRVSSAGTNAWN